MGVRVFVAYVLVLVLCEVSCVVVVGFLLLIISLIQPYASMLLIHAK